MLMKAGVVWDLASWDLVLFNWALLEKKADHKCGRGHLFTTSQMSRASGREAHVRSVTLPRHSPLFCSSTEEMSKGMWSGNK